MMGIRVFIVCVLLQAGSSTSATQREAEAARGPTLSEALHDPPLELARRVLGLSGEIYREVQRPFLESVPSVSWLTNLTFATAPRSAGFPGLCEASTIFVSFRPEQNAPPDSDVRTIVNALQTGRLYKIVGDTTPLPDTWNDDYGRSIAERCAAAGPVLLQPNGGVRAGHFFSGRFNGSSDFWPAHAYFAARALQKVTAAATSGALTTIPCEEDRDEPAAHFCAEPRSLLANLSLQRLNGFEIAPCRRGDAELCVSARFTRQSDSLDGQRMLAVEIRTDASHIDPPPSDFRILAVSISGFTIVY